MFGSGKILESGPSSLSAGSPRGEHSSKLLMPSASTFEPFHDPARILMGVTFRKENGQNQGETFVFILCAVLGIPPERCIGLAVLARKSAPLHINGKIKAGSVTPAKKLSCRWMCLNGRSGIWVGFHDSLKSSLVLHSTLPFRPLSATNSPKPLLYWRNRSVDCHKRKVPLRNLQ
jgi:hypothetical protein